MLRVGIYLFCFLNFASGFVSNEKMRDFLCQTFDADSTVFVDELVHFVSVEAFENPGHTQHTVGKTIRLSFWDGFAAVVYRCRRAVPERKVWFLLGWFLVAFLGLFCVCLLVLFF